MGGRGSGRRRSYSGKPETGDSMPLDIRKLTRKGLLVPGSSFSWQWLVNDREVAGARRQTPLREHEMLQDRSTFRNKKTRKHRSTAKTAEGDWNPPVLRARRDSRTSMLTTVVDRKLNMPLLLSFASRRTHSAASHSF